jgi:hypothetical protein
MGFRFELRLGHRRSSLLFSSILLRKCRINRLVPYIPRTLLSLSLLTHHLAVILSTLYGFQYWRCKINHKSIQVLQTYISDLLKFWFLLRKSFETLKVFIVTAATWNSITVIQTLSVLCYSLLSDSDCFVWFGNNFTVWLRRGFLSET